MRVPLYSLITILLLIPAYNVLSQGKQIKFNLVSGTNGVSLGKINGIARDNRGFMWFSDQTNRCIVRFDGSHMTKYVYDPNNPNSLGGYYPECLTTDADGNIWIGFFGAGLDKFDPSTNTYTHYRNQKNDPESLSNDTTTAVFVDHLNNVWVGNSGGLDLLDKQKGKFKHYHNIPNDSTSLSNNIVRAIYEDKKGELWIGTGNTFDGTNEGGLNHFDRTSGTFTRYIGNPSNSSTLRNNKVRAILDDSYGNLWLGTPGNNVHILDRKTGKVTRYPFLPSKNNGLGIPSPASNIDNITFITEDADRKIWIGTMESGIIRYDPQTKQMIHYTPNEDSSSWWAHATPDGKVWISTQHANLFYIDVKNVIPFFEGDNFFSINEESPTVVWYATSNGLLRKDYKDGIVKKFLNQPGDPNSLSSNPRTLLRDKTGNLWVGTDNALNLYDSKQGIFKRYYHIPADYITPNSKITSLCQDEDSNIWVGTSGAGLFIFNPGTGKFTNYKHNPGDGTTIYSDVIICLMTDGEHTIWVGTGNSGGLDKLDRQTGKIMHYMPGMTINSLHKDADGVFWVGTPAGLFYYDPKTDRFVSLSEKNSGLNVVNIASIISDEENNIWLGAEPGIYMINKTRDRIIRYGQANGLSDANNGFYPGSVIRKQDGELQFGDEWGYAAFYPKKLRTTSTKNQLYFTGLWLNNNPVNAGDYLLKGSLDSAKEMRLSHSQNIFSFSATTIDFSIGTDKKIFYKLENYDNEWRSASPEEQMQYFKVPPGNYTFRIRAAGNAAGDWQEKSISIIISPPWWSTWWAYCLYALVLIGFVILVYRYQKNQVVKAERERTRAKQLEQAKEIEKAYHQLKETQAQLIQSEKMASLGELTAGIAHEIQNPLNFVNNFSEVSRELIDELKSQKSKLKSEEQDEILNDIDANLEKINHHGKRADAIVKGMLQHSRTSTGQKEPTDINALADEYLRLAYHGLRAKDKSFNAKFETNFDNSIGKININPQDIGRVILNLINNAFYTVNEKAKQNTEGYEPTVIISTIKNNGKVEIKVKDNGNGIPQKILDKVFQPFFTTKPTGQGTGLGLSLAYDIVTKGHSGELKVETKEAEGSVFTILL